MANAAEATGLKEETLEQDVSAMTPDELADTPSSSFPISSPSFWTEAAQATVKRSRSPSPLQELLPPRSPDEEKHRTHADTTLTYLPNRLDPFLQDDPHSYLASAEYAPNKFGDIGDYMRKKEIKVQTQNRDIALASAQEGIPQIFTGQSFYINGNTHPPMEELRKMILQRGGEVRPVLRSKGMVKYIIAPMLTQSKFKQFERYKVVKEGWILESCKEGKMLDWSRWKLQPEGGWEAEGRKGLEGFFAGKPSQAGITPKDEVSEDESVTIRESSTLRPDSAIGDAPLAPIALPLSTQSLLRPVLSTQAPSRHAGPVAKLENPVTRDIPPRKDMSLLPSTSKPMIPISPGYVRPETPTKEKLPPNIQKAEGRWEGYHHSTEPNLDAARLLKNQEWRLKNTAERGNEGGFIDGYYQNSRLHHLSTWKAELKVLVAAAQRQSEEKSLSQPSASTLAPFSLANATLPRAAQSTSTPGERIIFHCDFDCFFVSCGLATRPHLKGKPAVVCHSQVGKSASSTSEIASASYEARAKGVKNGMSLGKARQLVGDSLETIPYEFETYKRFSLAFYTVLMGYADELQAVSVDEALIDVTSAVAARAAAPEEAEEQEPEEGIEGEQRKIRDPAVEIAQKIRDEVRALTEGCEVSIGIAHNILLAKLGTRRAKPAGVHHVVPAEVEALIAPLDVEDLPSIGYSIRGKIEEKFGTSTCGELLQQSKGSLRALLGPKTGDMVWGYLRGMDDRKLEPHKERKSISAEMNYGIRFQSQEQADICIADLAAEVSKRMKQVNAKGRLLTLKLMSRHPDAPLEPPKFLGHGWCETFNKSTAIANKGGSATDDPDILATESVKLLRAMKLDPKELRGVGIQITKLDGEKGVEREAGQGTLSFGVKRKRSDSIIVKADESLHAVASVKEVVQVSDTELNPQPDLVIEPEKEITDQDVILPVSSPKGISRSPSPGLARHEASLRAAEAGPSRLAVAVSSDGIDPDFLAALPPTLAQEVKRDYAITRGKSVPPPPIKSTTKGRATTESPSKPKTSTMHAAAHITRQLRPKMKVQMKASVVADLPLYGAWAKAADKVDAIDISADEDEEEIGGYRVSEIRDLGLDPEVFLELPEEMRKEIIEEERRKHRQRKVLHRPADTSRLRARNGTTRTASLSPGKASRAGSAPPNRPLAAVSLPPKPALLKATALPDVLQTITRWIDSRKGGPPADKDASKVRTYLVKCLDPGMGVGGMENAIEALKYMKLELRERWPDKSDEAGMIWWETWRGFVGAVNAAAVRNLGAPLII